MTDETSTTRYAYDAAEALSRWTESYSYDSRDRLTRACLNAHCSHYYAYAYDPVGNRTSLTTRQETTLYSYDLADELLSSSEAQGAEQNPIRFSGQYLDSASDLYNMRAREYAPETGTFLQVDPLKTDSGAPAAGAYVYVGDQPTVMTDPSGEKEAMVAGAIESHYQPIKAVIYALSYWQGDPGYARQGNDCTNYVSHALNYGGWHTDSQWEPNKGYYCFPFCMRYHPTPAWDAVTPFYKYATDKSRSYNHAVVKSNIRNATQGDVVLADWDRNGALNHAMLVTNAVPNGQIYISQHTNDKYDYPLLYSPRHGHFSPADYKYPPRVSIEKLSHDDRQESHDHWPKFVLLHIVS